MTRANEILAGGLWCGEVLERLSDYLDGDLAVEERGKVEAHLRACDGCARFGGAFKATVRALRRELSGPDPLPRRLRERLRQALDRGDS